TDRPTLAVYGVQVCTPGGLTPPGSGLRPRLPPLPGEARRVAAGEGGLSQAEDQETRTGQLPADPDHRGRGRRHTAAPAGPAAPPRSGLSAGGWHFRGPGPLRDSVRVGELLVGEAAGGPGPGAEGACHPWPGGRCGSQNTVHQLTTSLANTTSV